MRIRSERSPVPTRLRRVSACSLACLSCALVSSLACNKDIARADDILDDYEYTLLATEVVDGVETYEIDATPHEDAAIVWGKEIMTITAEHVVMNHAFFDQDGELVKVLETSEVTQMGGRTIAKRQRMHEIETPDEWTEISVESVEYGLELSDGLFTQSNLRNPRD